MAMLQDYVSVGFDPAAFWRLTPRLYVAHMKGAEARLEREHKGRAWLAWHGEALNRTKRMPPFDKFSGAKKPPPKAQSPDVLQAMCDALAKAWGSSSRKG